VNANIGIRYNRYLAIAARVVRRSLQEEKRVAAERRGETDLRFAKWDVRGYHLSTGHGNWHRTAHTATYAVCGVGGLDHSKQSNEYRIEANEA